MMTDAGRAALDKHRIEQGLDPKLPWGGRSPRVLTRAYERFTLEPLGDDAIDFSDDGMIEEQDRRFHYGY